MKQPDKKTLLEMYRTMQKIRQFETKCQEFFADGKIPGFVHLYLGEEATATGACANLSPKDMTSALLHQHLAWHHHQSSPVRSWPLYLVEQEAGFWAAGRALWSLR